MRTALALALLVPTLAAARPTLALRLAYAPAAGSAAGRVPMSEEVRAQVPLQLDALWRLGPVSAGAYGSAALGRAGGCEDAECSATVLRAGVQAVHELSAWGRRGMRPWLGAGVGWEWASWTRTRPGVETTRSWSGPEALAQAGLAWTLAPRLAAGPFVAVALGRYRSVGVETPSASASAGVQDRAVHAWIHLGVRGSFDL